MLSDGIPYAGFPVAADAGVEIAILVKSGRLPARQSESVLFEIPDAVAVRNRLLRPVRRYEGRKIFRRPVDIGSDGFAMLSTVLLAELPYLFSRQPQIVFEPVLKIHIQLHGSPRQIRQVCGFGHIFAVAPNVDVVR